MKIDRPTLLLDKSILIKNIETMAQKSIAAGAELKPHFKTHQSAAVGELFKAFGISSITVSSIEMAEYFAKAGWREIMIAFPVNVLRLEAIAKLAASVKLDLLINNKKVLVRVAKCLKSEVGFYIEIDSGQHRSGVDPHNDRTISSIIKRSESLDNLQFKGFYTHSGQCYEAETHAEVSEIAARTIELMSVLKDKYGTERSIKIGMGDTPSCSSLSNFGSIDEIRPGNFVFYDLMQLQLGSCSRREIAVALACPIVEVNHKKRQVVVHGGAVHLSKEFLLYHGNMIYGMCCGIGENGFTNEFGTSIITSISQEHGIIQMSSDDRAKVKVGDIIGIYPVHSCLAADCMGVYYDFSGTRYEMMHRC